MTLGLGPLPWLMNGEIFSEEAKVIIGEYFNAQMQNPLVAGYLGLYRQHHTLDVDIPGDAILQRCSTGNAH